MAYQYKRNEKVSAAVAKRTRKRYEKLAAAGAPTPGGYNPGQRPTGAVARKFKSAVASQNSKAANPVTERTGARLAALGGSVKGVDGTDGYTRAETQKVRKARRKQKYQRAYSRYLARGGATDA
jgi:hypothetical protein